MQKNPNYSDLIYEIIHYLKKNTDNAIEMGVGKDKIVIDPGIGFGKTVEHNLEIIRNLTSFKSMGYPVLIGPSRKSFIGTILNKDVNERLEGSLAVAAISAWNEADILRVHDVNETKMVLKMVESLKNL
jgi:dihydropteroate synthase